MRGRRVALFSTSAKILLLAVVILFATRCRCQSDNRSVEGEDKLHGDISISGAFALYPLATEWAEDFQKLHPRVKVDISAGGAGKGITDVLAGAVDFGMVSRDLYPEERERGAVGFAVAKDAVVPTINRNNPSINMILHCGITREEAKEIWLSDSVITWGELLGNSDRTPIHVYTRSDACGAAETWAQWFGAHQEDLEGVALYGDPSLLSAIQRDTYGIGFNNIGYVYDPQTHLPCPGIAVVPLDIDGDGKVSPTEDFYGTKDSLIKAIAQGRSPSPPARELYFVSKGIPTAPHFVEFLKYVMEEGQQRNIPAGYVPISEETENQNLRLLEQSLSESGAD